MYHIYAIMPSNILQNVYLCVFENRNVLFYWIYCCKNRVFIYLLSNAGFAKFFLNHIMCL